MLFYLVMFLLTITARDIHNSRLPQVTAGRLTSKQNPDYYAVLVKTGYSNEQYILTGYEGLEDGDEVFLVNNKK